MVAQATASVEFVKVLVPTLDEARSMLISVMQAPIIKLAQTANEVPGKLVRVVAAVKEQKEAEA